MVNTKDRVMTCDSFRFVVFILLFKGDKSVGVINDKSIGDPRGWNEYER
jgi:hypothetical protein